MSECLQDLMEDRRAWLGGLVDPQSDHMLSLIAGIYGAGSRIVELIGTEFSQMAARAPLAILEEHIALAIKEMLLAVVDVSHACDQLRHFPFSQNYALPDFDLLARQSAELEQLFQRSYPTRGHGTTKGI